MTPFLACKHVLFTSVHHTITPSHHHTITPSHTSCQSSLRKQAVTKKGKSKGGDVKADSMVVTALPPRRMMALGDDVDDDVDDDVEDGVFTVFVVQVLFAANFGLGPVVGGG